MNETEPMLSCPNNLKTSCGSDPKHRTTKRIMKTILTTLSLLCAMTLAVFAQDSEVNKLKERVSQLERQVGQKPQGAGDEVDSDVIVDKTGTDPRDFGNKFMPYYRHTSLDNDLEVDELALFGFFAFTKDLGMTYELPVAKQVDYSDVSAFKSGGSLPPGGPGTPLPPGGIPAIDLDPDGDEVGVGDSIFRFFYNTGNNYYNKDKKKQRWSIIPTIEMTVPTATEEALGGEALIMSPGLTFVTDLYPVGPTYSFFASMNFFDFDAFKDDSRGYTSRYRGRWFWMQPLSPPGPAIYNGLFMLTEFQPAYDFRESEFSLWIGPEIGKMLGDFGVIYAKPGFGVDPDETERDFTFEIGWRYFFN